MRNIIFIALIFLSLSGCFSRQKMQAITTLQGLAKERAEQEIIIKLEEKKFRLLVEAVKNNTIKKGLSEREVLARYGQPILMKQSDISGVDKVLIFVKPLDYSGREKVYLYFDEGKKLVLWEIK